jgi:hypothetical protein
VRLSGKAAKRLAGKTVRIRFDATGKMVASAKVRADGTFKATAPLPPERLATPTARAIRPCWATSAHWISSSAAGCA